MARLRTSWDPAQIARRDLNRVIEVRSQTEPGIRGNDVVLKIMASDEMKQLQEEMPSGYRVEIGGMLEESRDGQTEVKNSFTISFLAIVLLLVIQYNGWAKPLMILSTLPLALVGALPGLFITGNPLGFMPQLGILAPTSATSWPCKPRLPPSRSHGSAPRSPAHWTPPAALAPDRFTSTRRSAAPSSTSGASTRTASLNARARTASPTSPRSKGVVRTRS